MADRDFKVGDRLVWREPFNNGPEAGVVTSISYDRRVYYCTTTDHRWPKRVDYAVYPDVNEPTLDRRRFDA